MVWNICFGIFTPNSLGKMNPFYPILTIYVSNWVGSTTSWICRFMVSVPKLLTLRGFVAEVCAKHGRPAQWQIVPCCRGWIEDASCSSQYHGNLIWAPMAFGKCVCRGSICDVGRLHCFLHPTSIYYKSPFREHGIFGYMIYVFIYWCLSRPHRRKKG